jgi:hypothetical protein
VRSYFEHVEELTHWELEEHVENFVGTHWEQNNFNTPTGDSPTKEKKLGCIWPCLIGSKNVFVRLMVKA